MRGQAVKPKIAPGKPFSIMVYCGDVLGLGHLRRNTALVSRLVRDLPGTNALLLTSVSTGNMFECPEGVDVIKLPSLAKDDNGCVVARSLTLEQTEVRRLRTGLIDGLTRSFRPDLVLVDHYPGGVGGELLPTLRTLRASSDSPLTVLGLRDILDDPLVTTNRWRRQGVYRTIEQLYDAVLIYGSREVFDAGQRYRLERELTTDFRHCGFVCAEYSHGNRRVSRRELGLGDGKLVVITAGGGTDGYPMMKLCLDALRRLGPQPDFEVVCITGPFMNRDEINELRGRASGLPIRVLWCVERAPLYFKAADLVVTMAGYNTLLEAIRLKKKTLVIPRPGPSAEQEMRTEIFSRLGVVRRVGEHERSPLALSRLIVDSLNAEPPSATLPDMDGLDNAVRHLKTLLRDRQKASEDGMVAG